jgi:hypothetical protein
MRITRLLPTIAAAGALAACAPGATTEGPASAPRPVPEVVERSAEQAPEPEPTPVDETPGHTRRLARILAKHSKRPEVARRAAEVVVREAERHDIEPSLLAGVLLVENTPLDTSAVSRAGAVGLMQVMRFHAGKYDCESKNLRQLEANICHGAHVLRYNLKRSPSVRRALLGYNGCVGRRRTARCEKYPTKVLRHASNIKNQLAKAGAADRTVADTGNAKPAPAAKQPATTPPERESALPEGYAIAEVTIRPTDWMSGRKLKEAKLADGGLVALRIRRRDGKIVELPEPGTKVSPGDVLLVYGPEAAARTVAQHPRTRRGDELATR